MKSLEQTANEIHAASHKEIHMGTSGNGSRLYCVVTVRNSDGAWKHVERFLNEAEALNWIKWA
jgi:hypothetical protein